MRSAVRSDSTIRLARRRRGSRRRAALDAQPSPLRGLELSSVRRPRPPTIARQHVRAATVPAGASPARSSTPSSSLAAGFTISTTPVGSSAMTPSSRRLSTADSAPRSRSTHRESHREALAHLVDARGEAADLVGESVAERVVEVASGDHARRAGESPDTARDEARDSEADDDRERHRDQRPEHEAAAQRIACARREAGRGARTRRARPSYPPRVRGRATTCEAVASPRRNEATARERRARCARCVGKASQRDARQRRRRDHLARLRRRARARAARRARRAPAPAARRPRSVRRRRRARRGP